MNRRQFLTRVPAVALAATLPQQGPSPRPMCLPVVPHPVNARLIGKNGWHSQVVVFDGNRVPLPLVFEAPRPDTYQFVEVTDGIQSATYELGPAVALWGNERLEVRGLQWPPPPYQPRATKGQP